MPILRAIAAQVHSTSRTTVPAGTIVAVIYARASGEADGAGAAEVAAGIMAAVNASVRTSRSDYLQRIGSQKCCGEGRSRTPRHR